MGFKVEINTMLRLISSDPKPEELVVGQKYSTLRENRIYVINIPILLLAEDFSVLGYCLIHKASTTSDGTVIEYSLMNRFSEEKKEMYTDDLKRALKDAGYL